VAQSSIILGPYGPWDKRYYHVLAFLEARGLIVVRKQGKSVHLALTKAGKELAGRLLEEPSFTQLVAHMRQVAEAFGKQTGNELKALIYRTFGEDVSDRPLGHVIGAHG
jgi:DNA-binding PadR family transcriptional regulator